MKISTMDQFIDWRYAPENATRCVIVRTWLDDDNGLVAEEQLANYSIPVELREPIKIIVNGVEVIDGDRNLKVGKEYYSPECTQPRMCAKSTNQLTTTDFYRVKNGLAYHSEELAIARARAMLGMTQ